MICLNALRSRRVSLKTLNRPKWYGNCGNSQQGGEEACLHVPAYVCVMVLWVMGGGLEEHGGGDVVMCMYYKENAYTCS